MIVCLDDKVIIKVRLIDCHYQIAENQLIDLI